MKEGSLVVVLPTCKLPNSEWLPIADGETIYTIRYIIPPHLITKGVKKFIAIFWEGDMIDMVTGIHYGIWLEYLREVQPPMDMSFIEDLEFELVNP